MNVAKNSLNPLTWFFESVEDHDDFSSDSSDNALRFIDEERGREEEPSGNKLAKREHRSVRIWRSLVLVMLLAGGATMSFFMFYLLRSNEVDDFEVNYDSLIRNIEESGTASVKNLRRGFEVLSESITAHADANNETFPLVTVPAFELYGGYMRRLSGVEMVSFTPIVQNYQVKQWIPYTSAHKDWLMESRDLITAGNEAFVVTSSQKWFTPLIYQFDESNSVIEAADTPFLPIWQTSPPPFDPSLVNYNMMAEPSTQRLYRVLQETRSGWCSEVMDLSRLGKLAISEADHKVFHASYRSPVAVMNASDESSLFPYPHSLYEQPVFENLTDKFSPLVGIVFGIIPWEFFLQKILPDGAGTIYVVMENSLNQSFTYLMNGTSAMYLGVGDKHNAKYDYMKRTFSAMWPSGLPASLESQVGLYRFQFYPSDDFSNQYQSLLPIIMAVVVAAIFLALAMAFFIYDLFVRTRNSKVVNAAIRSNRIVSSQFPSTVRDRLLADQEEAERRAIEQQQGTQTRLKKFLANYAPTSFDMETENIMFKTQPIADLFPETTIMFADIAGFTAWSSAREPSQVFTLLETVFKSFDEIAKRRRVFKVETVGDCYVAATGLPEPRQDHAVAMARFAKDCMKKMQMLTRKLEVSLGPDTADLAMRMGIHSGPVTAGVLRGERSRFQLFGDTMNTASRMESTGMRDKIQISQDTADLLVASGKKSWIIPREDTVVAKGKGEMRTFWLEVGRGKSVKEPIKRRASAESLLADMSLSSDDVTEGWEGEEGEPSVSSKIARLIDWNVDVLLQLLKSVVARRLACGNGKGERPVSEDFSRSVGKTVLDEVEERIALPEFDPSVAMRQLPPEEIAIDDSTQSQLYEYVAGIAAMYRDIPFHNFEHASHVTLSVSKLLARIVAPTDLDFQNNDAKNQSLHDHTYGITSDPLTQFACVLSALIHDVDHTGVPNTQLVKENTAIAKYYRGRSVAEQNSVDVAWDLLLEDAYIDLRRTIYTTDEELHRFRKLVVNSVLATDIMDKDLKDRRNARWELAFSGTATHDPSATVQRKATIVIEHLIQASDVAHTMQHWHIYQKWNARLFEEMYMAYKDGRAEKNPADFWYTGELGFFDFYIIPLAKKLKDCGVFGVSSDEYLNYAERNRKEWESKGRQVVSELVERVRIIHNSADPALQSSYCSACDLEETIPKVIS